MFRNKSIYILVLSLAVRTPSVAREHEVTLKVIYSAKISPRPGWEPTTLFLLQTPPSWAERPTTSEPSSPTTTCWLIRSTKTRSFSWKTWSPIRSRCCKLASGALTLKFRNRIKIFEFKQVMAVDQVLERGGRLLDAKCVCLFMCLNFLDVHKTRWLLISWPQRAVQIGERRKKCWFLPSFVSRHFCLLLRRSSSKKCFVIVAINLLLDFSNCPAPAPWLRVEPIWLWTA